MSNFRRVIEDFSCENCSTFVKGKGYTDHCPNCLWGKHVDDKPGDRAEKCHGLMEPISAVYETDYFMINYKCAKCGVKKRFKSAPEDNNEVLQRLYSMVSVK